MPLRFIRAAKLHETAVAHRARIPMLGRHFLPVFRSPLSALHDMCVGKFAQHAVARAIGEVIRLYTVFDITVQLPRLDKEDFVFFLLRPDTRRTQKQREIFFRNHLVI